MHSANDLIMVIATVPGHQYNADDWLVSCRLLMS